MEKSTSQKVLKVLSIIAIAAGIIAVVGGIWFMVAMDTAGGTNATILGTAGGGVIIVGGLVNLLIGWLGLRGANDPSKIGPTWVLSLIGLIFDAILLILGFIGEGSLNGHALGSLIGVLIIFLLANNIKNQA